MENPPIDILYVGAHGRSGSTILDLLLGLDECLVSLGEMRHLWAIIAGEDDFLCGCGKHHAACPFWAPAFEKARSMSEEGRLTTLAEAFRRIDHRTTQVPARNEAFQQWVDAQLSPFRDLIVAVYQAIGRREQRTPVDSSKYAWYARWLQAQPEFSVHCLHLVRDSRGVAYSRMRKKKRSDSTKKRRLGLFTPRHTCQWWKKDNEDLRQLEDVCDSYAQLKYEDLVESPRRLLRAAVGKLQVTCQAGFGKIGEGEADFGINHTVFGNPCRMKTGVVAIRRDDRWRRAMPWGAFLLVTLLTWSELRRHGYKLLF